jgi:hypothetical protein
LRTIKDEYTSIWKDTEVGDVRMEEKHRWKDRRAN